MSKKKHDVPEEWLASLQANYQKPEDLIGEDGLLKPLSNLVVERALEAELTEHLGHGKNEPVANQVGNTCEGNSKKTLKGEFGELPIDAPRHRNGSGSSCVRLCRVASLASQAVASIAPPCSVPQ